MHAELVFTSSVNFWSLLQYLILPVILPALVGLVTKWTTSSGWKAIILLALTVVTTFLTTLLTAAQSGAETFDVGAALQTALVTFVLGVGVHLGILKPTGATAQLQATFDKDAKVIDGVVTSVHDDPLGTSGTSGTN